MGLTFFLKWIKKDDAIIAVFRPWWPGWNGERKGLEDPSLSDDLEDTSSSSSLGIKLSRRFDFSSRGSSREERLVDYYFWALSDLRQRLAFVCERRQKNIGCLRAETDGSDYDGLVMDKSWETNVRLNYNFPLRLPAAKAATSASPGTPRSSPSS